jgi:hypothetical protein
MILGALVLGPLCLAHKRLPSNQNLRSAQEEDIREAAFLYLFGVGTGPDPDYSHYCLSVDSMGFSDRHDPSDSLLKRFSQTRRTIRRFSECELVDKHEEPGNPEDLFAAVKDKESGKPAWIISLGPITWVNGHKVRVEGERYCGGLCGWSATLEVTFRNRKWKARIAPGASIMVS